jgi:RNA polymerase sigma factor for flagellar operon FliA
MSEPMLSAALDAAQEKQYIIDWLPLVNRVVRQLSAQVNTVLSQEDMQQIALMALLEALRRYGTPNAGFAGYAITRMRGAVLDTLRQQDWRPRQVRQKTHKINDGIRALTRQLGREPVTTEICQSLGLDCEQYQQYRQSANAVMPESLENLLYEQGVTPDQLHGRSLEEDVVCSRTLHYALRQLDKREQHIFALYYQHELSLKEVARSMQLTEARVCQLNKRIAEKIRAYF